MTTIEEIVTEHITGDAIIPEGLIPALQEREQEAMDNLHLYAERFGLVQPIVSRVIVELGLGSIADTEREFIEAQYLAYIEEYKQAVAQRVAMMRAQGIPVQAGEFVDPFTQPLDVDVPDTLPEA